MTRRHPPLANVSNADSKKAADWRKAGPVCRESSALCVTRAAGGQTAHLAQQPRRAENVAT